MADHYTDIDLDGVTITRGKAAVDVHGVIARVHWDDTASPQLMVTDARGDYVELDTSDLWMSQVAAAARAKLNTPAVTSRIYYEVVHDRYGQREAAQERQSSWMRQAAE